MKRAILFLIALSVVCMYVAEASATYYKWVDDNGKVWITDYPNPKYAKKKGLASSSQDRDEKLDSSTVVADDQAEQRRESSTVLIIPEGMRKKITAAVRDANIPEIPDSMIGMIAVFALAGLTIFYLYACMCLFFIARKLALPNAWTAWVPILNFFLFLNAAGKPWWWAAVIALLFVLTMIPVLGLIFGLFMTAFVTYLWMCITHNVGKNRWLGLLMLVPVAMLVFPAYLAFSKYELFIEPAEPVAAKRASF